MHVIQEIWALLALRHVSLLASLSVAQFHTSALCKERYFDFHANAEQLLASLQTGVAVIMIGTVLNPAGDGAETPVVAYLLHGEDDIAALEGYKADNASKFKPTFEGRIRGADDGYHHWMFTKRHSLETHAGRAAFVQQRRDILAAPATPRFSWNNLLGRCPNTHAK